MTGTKSSGRARAFALCWCGIALLGARSLWAQTAPHEFNVPAQPATTGIPEFARQAGIQILVAESLVHGKRTSAVVGSFSIDVGLKILLQGTDLVPSVQDEKTLILVRNTGNPSVRSVDPSRDQPNPGESETQSSQDVRRAQADQANAGPQVASDSAPKEDESLTEIVVTGTHIRGVAPAGSPLKVYSRSDIDESGVATLSDFARLMPENFSGLDPGTISTTTSRFDQGAFENAFAGATFNLHGIGATSTLTLLNGQRIAPGGSNGSFFDTSQIPLAAIDHIEVLPDGASATYGADAVAGVVNIVTRKDFDGAQTAVRYGAATSGGDREVTASQVIGTSWSSGNALLTYEYDDQGGLDASQRDYIPRLAGPDSLLPENRRNSALLTVRESLGDAYALSGEGIFSSRDFLLDALATSGPSSDSGRVQLSGVSGTIERALPGNWHAQLTGSYSKLEQRSLLNVPATTFQQDTGFDTNLAEGDLAADGPLFSLPGGALRAAVGASFRGEQATAFQDNVSAGVSTPVPTERLQRHVSSAYAELFVPIVGGANAPPAMRRLDLSAAARFDHYSDFGSSTNPKIGLTWEPAQGIDVRGTFGRSFRAPLLSDLFVVPQYYTYPYPSPASPTGVTDTLDNLSSGNAQLRPETSKSYTVGLDLTPPPTRALNMSITYFHIAFQQRISQPPLTDAFGIYSDPTEAAFLTPYITFHPSPAVVAAAFRSPGFVGDFSCLFANICGSGNVQAIFDDRITNIAATTASGLDLSSRYSLDTDYGQFTFSLAAEHQISNSYQATPGAPSLQLLDTLGEPLSWKGRGSIGWQNHGLGMSIAVNYAGHYENPLVTPSEPIGSWTTADVYVSYEIPKTVGQPWANFAIALSVQNVTNERPPYVNVPPQATGQTIVPFDPANASPVGRLIALQLSKRL